MAPNAAKKLTPKLVSLRKQKTESPMTKKPSAYLSKTESKKPPNLVTLPVSLANCPSTPSSICDSDAKRPAANPKPVAKHIPAMIPKVMETSVIIHGLIHLRPTIDTVMPAERWTLIHLNMNRSEGLVIHTDSDSNDIKLPRDIGVNRLN
jgi:hypothetical protein